jgi:hypothetical protein
MAEVKNSFLSSKMNKDLDDRLIPNSEYRDALNIEVGKSETNNIGVLQNVYGNVEIPVETIPDLECIGMFMDNQNNRIYQFLTNYTDPNPSQIILCTSPLNTQPVPLAGWIMKITVYDLNSLTYSTLVEGTFLNFSKTNLVLGLNLIEGLLFWSDNRNQPRKINYNKAIGNSAYYTTEVQISVAKYAPVDPISLIRKATATVVNVIDSSTFELDSVVGIVEGMTIVATGVPSCDYTYVMSVNPISNEITTYLGSPTISSGLELTFLISTMTNKADEPTWPGDPSFLEDKYVRFSYRFKFDDNEYSLMAPFTQIAYVPRQKGYFLNGDETAAYRSTVVQWMENNINNIELLVPLPDTGSNVNSTYKITDVDILYKESDSLVVNVLDTIPWTTISNAIPNTNVYNYPYQSQKPYKTLNESQTTRVYDIVPTRALSQEIAGNRVIYGNFYNMYTPPANINYNTAVQPKSNIFTNFIEYPNHTLKQNRNYQVGFVLSDKFGRQSSVLLSTVDLENTVQDNIKYGGSTVYAPYESEGLSIKCWFGNALLVLVNDPIASTRNIQLGTPGLYAEPTTISGFSIIAGSITGNIYDFTIDPGTPPAGPPTSVIPVIGESMRGEFTDYVTIRRVGWLDTSTFPLRYIYDPSAFPSTPSGDYRIITNGQVNNLYLPITPIPGVVDVKFAYNINEIGWYSYKVVVKQQQQDYYNAYLPGILDGYPYGQTSGSQVVYSGTGPTATSTLENGINTTSFPVGEEGKTSHIVLINDNINKIPRDLTEVGPDQKQYRSSVQLFGRVENSALTNTFTAEAALVDNKYTTTISYLLGPGGELENANPGDGINCRNAIPPYTWYANTVVTSNIVDPTDSTKGIITFTPGNWTRTLWGPLDITITRAESIQYFPSRKADVVSSIATAADFDFLDNTVDNVSGRAGINFYQLQTKPLIGRISTAKRIGVLSKLMVPFLSVYETVPDFSSLALFWETASTGYISDLNYDVLSGYNGPASINPEEFIFFEDQDPKGTDPNTGDADSKYITSDFEILNNTGFPLSLYSVPTFSLVTTVSGDVVTNKFDIEETSPGSGFYRFIIKDYFVFDYGASLGDSTFNFEIKVEWQPGVFAYINYTGRLGNIAPSFNQPASAYDRVIQEDADFIVNMDAKNGARVNPGTDPLIPVPPPPVTDQIDLYWEIIGGNAANYFEINPVTGDLRLRDPNVLLGTYILQIRVWDAFNATLGGVSGPNPYNSKSDTISVSITVGPQPVNDYLQEYDTTNAWIWEYYTGSTTCNPVPGQGYGAVYIGKGDYQLDSITRTNTNLPDLTQTTPFPPSTSAYQKYVNVQQANGADLSSDPAGIFGLTQGELEWTITTVGLSSEYQFRQSEVKFILYYRPSIDFPNNVWVSIFDDNNVGSDTDEWTNGVVRNDLPPGSPNTFGVRTASIGASGTSVEKQLSFITSTPGEYCLVVWHNYNTSDNPLDPPPFVDCAVHFSTGVSVRDANYSYVHPIVQPNPVIVSPLPAYEYNVQLTEYAPPPTIGDPNAVPYNTQDATTGFPFLTSGTLAADALIGTNILNLNVADFQIVAGLYATSTLGGLGSQVTGVIGTQVILSAPIGTTLPAGTSIAFNVYPSPTGTVYATTNNGIHVKQFYLDSAFSTPWTPPVPDKFYLFQNKNRNYNEVIPSGGYYAPDPPITNSPIFSAKFDVDGRVVNVPVAGAPVNTVQTAWTIEEVPTPEPLYNFGRNVTQSVTIA